MFNIGDIVMYNPEHFTSKDFRKMRGKIIRINTLSGGIISVKWYNNNDDIHNNESNYMAYELAKINNPDKDLFGNPIL